MHTPLNNDLDSLLELGKVIQSDKQFIWVEVQRKSACGGCKSSEGCGTGSLSKLFAGRQTSILKLPNASGLKVGDEVVLQLGKNDFLKQIFMAYGLPLLGFFIGALLGPWGGALLTGGNLSEIGAIVGSVFGLISGWWIAQKIYRPVLPQVIEFSTGEVSI